ncbi:MAG: T9SS type A sorting domain-containing protein [Ignavibacteriales bacterium]|nr:T9SS type A sorting domain-containing protein [Ignavibacteriales bacterium]
MKHFFSYLTLLFFFTASITLSQVEQLFFKRLNSGSKTADKSLFVRVDNAGNAYVGGISGGKFRFMKYTKNGSLLKEKTFSDIDTLKGMELDMNNDVIVAGVTSAGLTENDYAVMKIANSGDSAKWSKTYHAGGKEFLSGLAIDPAGDIYVTGYRMIGALAQNNIDFITVKFLGSTGDTVWSKRFNSVSNEKDFARAIVYSSVDTSVIVSGDALIVGQNYNYYTIKYKATTGDSVWAISYNNNNSTNEDNVVAMTIDSAGSVYVTGTSLGIINDIATVKYTMSGQQDWVARYNQDRDFARAISVDNAGFVYVTGVTLNGPNYDIVIVKYNTSNGNAAWSYLYNGAASGKEDVAGIGTDPYGNVMVVGYETGITNEISSGTDAVLVMVSPSGVFRASRAFTGQSTSLDTVGKLPQEYLGMTIDQSTGAIWAVGYDSSSSTNFDFLLAKYESRNSIRGKVKRDIDGDTLTTTDQRPFSGGKIVLDSIGAGDIHYHLDSTYSDANGNFILPLVFDGTYELDYYSPDTLWQSLQSIPGTGGDGQVPVSPATIQIVVSNSQISVNNTFIVFSYTDSTKYRTFTPQDYGTKKARKISKKGKFLGFPNPANARDTTFAKAFPKGSGKKFIIGVAGTAVDSFWWIYLKKSADIQKAYPMSGSAQYFVKYGGKEYPKRDKNGNVVPLEAKKLEKAGLTNAKHNNHLASEQVALKTNILSSDNQITPSGLKNLIYNDGNVDNPLNEKTVGEISKIVDTLLTFRGRQIVSLDYITVFPTTLDTVVSRINKAFRAALPSSDSTKDTVSLLVNGLQLSGASSISESPYLRYNSNPTPRSNIDFPVVNEIPDNFTLYQNYPNPFNPTTTIRFDLPYDSKISIKIYNVLGQVVANLFKDESFDEGVHELDFDASALSSGVYFIRLSAIAPGKGSYENFKKMMLLK